MISSPLLKKLVILFILLSALSLYTINFIPKSFIDLMKLTSTFMMLIIVFFDQFSNQKEDRGYNFKWEVNLIFLAVFFSMFIARYYHNQDFSITFVSQRFMYFYLLYYTLHALKINGKDLEELLIPFGIVYATLYILQYALFPIEIFESRVELDRGTVRIFIPGSGFMFLSYYKCLNHYLSDRKIKYLLLAMLFFIVGGILTGTRQSLASLTLMSTAFIFFNKQVKSRTVIIAFASLAAMAFFIIFQDFLTDLIDLTQKQMSNDKPNIRVLAATFFLTDFMPANIAYIFGNGMDSMNAEFGMRVSHYKLILGFYQSDIGIIGDYTKFGLLFVIAQLSIMSKLIFGKLPANISYYRYFFIASAITMFTGSNGYARIDGIAFICIIFYIIDYYKREENKEKQIT
jgi:hypothetical protein